MQRREEDGISTGGYSRNRNHVEGEYIQIERKLSKIEQL
jgi:hypothetical protein